MNRALGIAFSARRRANSYECVDLSIESLRDDGFETEIIDLFDYTIEPCSHCAYECLSEHITAAEAACPTALLHLATYPTQGNAREVSVADGYAHVADYDAGWRVVDMSSPVAMIETTLRARRGCL